MKFRGLKRSGSSGTWHVQCRLHVHKLMYFHAYASNSFWYPTTQVMRQYFAFQIISTIANKPLRCIKLSNFDLPSRNTTVPSRVRDANMLNTLERRSNKNDTISGFERANQNGCLRKCQLWLTFHNGKNRTGKQSSIQNARKRQNFSLFLFTQKENETLSIA